MQVNNNYVCGSATIDAVDPMANSWENKFMNITTQDFKMITPGIWSRCIHYEHMPFHGSCICGVSSLSFRFQYRRTMVLEHRIN